MKSVAAERPEVDLDQAIQCVELAQLSYRSPQEAAGLALERFGYGSFESLTRRDGRDYLLLVEDDAQALIAVRGTNDFRDWLTNLQLLFRETPIGRVHQGFYQVARSFQPGLEQFLSGSPKPVLLTGHSMGGAVAAVLAMLLEQAGFPVVGLYTFGQPQLGFGSYRRYHRANCRFTYVRFVHGADAFAVWTAGRSHVPGIPCYFDLRGRISFRQQLDHIPRPDLRFHRLEYYRHFLRLNRLRQRAMAVSEDATLIQRR